MRRLVRYLRRWSPWHLHEAMRDIHEMLNGERNDGGVPDGKNTWIEKIYRYSENAMRGMPLDEAWRDAERYRIEGRTLIIGVRKKHV